MSSATIRSEFALIEAGFAKLPVFAGNADKVVVVNPSAAALIAVAASAIPGLAIGTNVQAYDADLTAIAALTSAANKVPYATGAGAWALADFSAAGRALVDDADAPAQLVTLGALPLAGGTMTGNLLIPDSMLQIVGSATASKKAVFEVDGLTAATTRTITVPDRNITLNTLTSVTASLGADVALNNGAAYFDGPSVVLPAGTWFLSGTVTLSDPTGAATMLVKLWDGTTVIDSGGITVGATLSDTVALSGPIELPVGGTVTMAVKDVTFGTGIIAFNASANGKDSTLTAIRIG